MNKTIRRLPPTIRLVLYADPALLPALQRPALAMAGPIVELARRTRLTDPGLPIERASTTTTSARRAWHRVRRRLHRPQQGHRSATLVCHIDELDGLLPCVRGVSDVRLLWHPADRPDPTIEITLRRLEDTPLGRAVGPSPVYHCVLGRPATGHDWFRAASCPVFEMLANTARRRRHRLSAGPLAIEAPRMIEAPVIDTGRQRA